MTADENDPARARLTVFPFPLMIAVKDHVHALKDETLLVILEVENALRAQNVLALGRHKVLHPGKELVRIERLGGVERNRLHVFIMIVLQPAMVVMMIVVMIVMMIVIVAIGQPKVGVIVM